LDLIERSAVDPSGSHTGAPARRRAAYRTGCDRLDNGLHESTAVGCDQASLSWGAQRMGQILRSGWSDFHDP
jgi:hypothetical protein